MRKDFGLLVLRLMLGALLLFHGVNKLLNGIGGIEQMISSHGLPSVLAYGVYLGEVVGPILVILGLFSRIGGLLIVVNMIVAILLAGLGNLFSIGQSGGYALELECFYLFSGLAVALLGAGRFSLGGEAGPWN
jgi:putative oxidoreductase